ncbi:hypothetical protein, partial [Burkholderia sp. MSh2]|uniref:hypothetical protein n=1 Tax=Burkholderia sp. MSh2 TaxID=1506588 RepID=UPI001F32A954
YVPGGMIREGRGVVRGASRRKRGLVRRGETNFVAMPASIETRTRRPACRRGGNVMQAFDQGPLRWKRRAFIG